MRHAERPMLHVHFAPRSPSECRSDDVVAARRKARGSVPPPLLAVRRAPFDTQLLRIKNIHGLFNYFSLHDFDKRVSLNILCFAL